MICLVIFRTLNTAEWRATLGTLVSVSKMGVRNVIMKPSSGDNHQII